MLKKNKNIVIKKPVVLLVLDGVGYSKNRVGNAVNAKSMPKYHLLMNKYLNTRILAHGKAVGLPSDQDMGNSEVGHNAMGAGRIFPQGAKLINEAIKSGTIWKGKIWQEIVKRMKKKATLHFIGLLSDGNIHSHIDHLFALIERAKKDGMQNVRIHILLDGRDVAETSALKYIDQLEQFLKKVNDNYFDAKIASGGGRMEITMDRYEANWKMVEKGWRIHKEGIGRYFENASEAVKAYRKEQKGIIDQYLPGFVIAKDSKPIGKINDGDAVILFNFRGDRAIEISRAFTESNFKYFKRGKFKDIYFAGMTEYDGDLKIPQNYLVSPPPIENTIGKYLADLQIKQFSIAETQKFGHITYFWNGNRSDKFDDKLEDYQEIPSDKQNFDKKPEMKSLEIANYLIKAIKSGKYDFLKANFANGDMIGHTGDFKATVKAMKYVDRQIARIANEVLDVNGVLIITADHGNAEDMFMRDKNDKLIKKAGKYLSKTSHSKNLVNFTIIGKKIENYWRINENKNNGLANVATTILNLLGYQKPDKYANSLIIRK